MFTSRSVILVCLLGIVVSICVYFYIPCDLVQGLSVGCLSSFIVTLGVTLMAYKSDRVEYLRQTYTSLKQIYHDLSCIDNYVMALTSEGIALAVNHKDMDLDDIQVKYELLAKVEERYEGLKSLNDTATHLGSYMGVLISNTSKVHGFKTVCGGKITYEGIVSYRETLDKYAEDLYCLIKACWGLLGSYRTVRGIGILDETLGKALRSSDDLLATVDKIQGRTDVLKKLTEELILKVEDELATNLNGNPWENEKQIASVATSCAMSKDLQNLK